jgi:hypothetical protein
MITSPTCPEPNVSSAVKASAEEFPRIKNDRPLSGSHQAASAALVMHMASGSKIESVLAAPRLSWFSS